jgi:hypothetical protein
MASGLDFTTRNVLNPYKGAQESVASAGDIFSKYIDKGTKAKAAAENQRRFELKNARDQSKHDAEMDEIDRAKEQRRAIDEYAPIAGKMARPTAISQNKPWLNEMNTGMVAVGEKAASQLESTNPEYKALVTKRNELQASRDAGGFTPEQDKELYDISEQARNMLVNSPVPGMGGLTLAQAMSDPYDKYKVSKEESERATTSRLMEEGVGFADATATSPLLSKDRIARKTIQAEDAAVKSAAAERAKEVSKQRLDTAKVYEKMDESSGYKSGSSSSGSSSGKYGLDLDSVSKLLEAHVDETAWAAPGTMNQAEAEKVLMGTNNVLRTYMSGSDAKEIVENALVDARDSGISGVSLTEQDFKNSVNATLKARGLDANILKKKAGKPYSGYSSGGGSAYNNRASQLLEASLGQNTSALPTGSFEERRLQTGRNKLKGLLDAYSTPSKSTKESKTKIPKEVGESDVSVKEPEKVIEKDALDKELDSAIYSQDRMEAGYTNVQSAKQQRMEDSLAAYNVMAAPKSDGYYEAGPGPTRDWIKKQYGKFASTPAGKEAEKAASVLNMDVLDYYMKYLVPLGKRVIPSFEMPYSRNLLTPEEKRQIQENSK